MSLSFKRFQKFTLFPCQATRRARWPGLCQGIQAFNQVFINAFPFDRRGCLFVGHVSQLRLTCQAFILKAWHLFAIGTFGAKFRRVEE